MTGELQHYDRGGQIDVRPTNAPTPLDEWVLVVRDVSTLAAQIADTPFVPDGMRGNAAAVTAAILTGREMGLGPMTSLQHIHVIKGKPGKSAEIMRALVQAAGHEIRDVEVTDTRVVLEGRRRGEQQWTRVSFTSDQAKRARIDLGGYPEDKLYARATTRLCRRKFAKEVGGIAATIEELEDDYPDAVRDVAEPATAPDPPKRTARRRTPVTPKPTPAAPAEPAAAVVEAAGPPPLPGDDEEQATADESERDAAEALENVQDPPVTRPQLDRLHAQFSDLGVTERDAKLHAVSLLVHRRLRSSSDLTKREASQAIDILAGVLADGNPHQFLADLLTSLEDGEEE